METIQNSAIYTRKLESGYLLKLYYLVFWKGYLEEENTWKPTLAVQHLRKLINSFYKDHSNKPIATSKAIDTAPLMVRPTIRLTALKQK